MTVAPLCDNNLGTYATEILLVSALFRHEHGTLKCPPYAEFRHFCATRRLFAHKQDPAEPSWVDEQPGNREFRRFGTIRAIRRAANATKTRLGSCCAATIVISDTGGVEVQSLIVHSSGHELPLCITGFFRSALSVIRRREKLFPFCIFTVVMAEFREIDYLSELAELQFIRS